MFFFHFCDNSWRALLANFKTPSSVLSAGLPSYDKKWKHTKLCAPSNVKYNVNYFYLCNFTNQDSNYRNAPITKTKVISRTFSAHLLKAQNCTNYCLVLTNAFLSFCNYHRRESSASFMATWYKVKLSSHANLYINLDEHFNCENSFNGITTTKLVGIVKWIVASSFTHFLITWIYKWL